MRSRAIAFASVLILGTAISCSDKNDPTSPVSLETYVANMTGAKERPTPTPSTATGTGTFVFESSGEISYLVTVPSSTPLSALPTGLHIHAPADTGQFIGVMVGFNGFNVATSGVMASGTIRGVSAAVSLDSLKSLIRGGKVYLNLHSTTYTGGEIRGQLTLAP
jgi:hypothetical protein